MFGDVEAITQVVSNNEDAGVLYLSIHALEVVWHRILDGETHIENKSTESSQRSA